jgi:hypothetical protein
MSARTGTPSARAARGSVCKRRAPPRPTAPRRSRPGKARQGALDRRREVLRELRKRGRRGRRPGVHDERHRRGNRRAARAPKNLAQPTTDPIAHDRVAHALRNRDSEARSRCRVSGRQHEHQEMSAGNARSGGVALFEFPALAEAVVPGEGLGDGRTRVHTESLLRPFRRRADRTARPDRVRIRTRKPCVRLRRRLFGW